MNSYKLCACLFVFLVAGIGQAQEPDADFKVQGEYSGTLNGDGQEFKYGLQVIALGDGKFAGAGYMGGLPGDGWDESEVDRVESTIKDGTLTLVGSKGSAKVKDGSALITHPEVGELGSLQRVTRESKTLGKKAPQDAVVLFDGSSVENWEFKGKPGKMTAEGLLKQGTASKQVFEDHQIHIEFLLPYMPKARSQKRGNSGIYVQGRYEVQMLDSFGLSGKHDECGGIYKIKKPAVNMCYPPMQWQTYDIEFHAAKYDGNKKVKNAWMNVDHNGVRIHEAVELPNKTTAAPNDEGPAGGFIFLQNHGSEVRYRNIWVDKSVPMSEEDGSK